MKPLLTAVCGFSLLISGSIAFAQEGDAAAASRELGTSNARASDTESEQVISVGKNDERVVCRRTKVTGSRVSTKRVCQTEAQWALELAEARRAVERGQNQRTLSN